MSDGEGRTALQDRNGKEEERSGGWSAGPVGIEQALRDVAIGVGPRRQDARTRFMRGGAARRLEQEWMIGGRFAEEAMIAALAPIVASRVIVTVVGANTRCETLIENGGGQGAGRKGLREQRQTQDERKKDARTHVGTPPAAITQL
ncbi:hypothetical protein [Methylosinus trichosporium]|uniref:hypothetical protein n=1 Tax=Methylosinus trichosporium TaxID=426 RepID=UPI0004644816|nr:hypothetical protein [Methylosinus trichosporium]